MTKDEIAIARIELAQVLSELFPTNPFAFPTREWFLANQYLRSRQLPDGRWIAVTNQIYTTSLYVDVTERSAYRKRFCFERTAEAVQALEEWDGTGDPPGPWIKEKPGDRMNPRWLAAAKEELNGRPDARSVSR